MTFDQKNRRLQFRPVSEDPSPGAPKRIGNPAKQPLGVHIRLSGGGEHGSLEIEMVSDDSLAEKAGVKAGDVILAINGKAVADLDRAQLATEFSKDKVLLKVRRGETTREIPIQR